MFRIRALVARESGDAKRRINLMWFNNCLPLVLSAIVIRVLGEIARSTCKGVWFGALLPWPVRDLEVKLRHVLRPLSLSAVKAFICHECLEYLVIRKDLN